MNIFLLGGWMMWPLSLVSVAVVAVAIERLLLFSSCPFPSGAFGACLAKALEGDAGPLLAELEKAVFLRRFAALLAAPDHPRREAALRAEGEAVLSRLEKHLALLAFLARIAPLLGLLGTVLGMISTFLEIADAQAGVDMNQLAKGIWQALITTAAGLAIAVFALFFLHLFQQRVNAAASALSSAAAALAPPAGSTADGTAAAETSTGGTATAGTATTPASSSPAPPKATPANATPPEPSAPPAAALAAAKTHPER